MKRANVLALSVAILGASACGEAGLGGTPPLAVGSKIFTTSMVEISSATNKGGDVVQVKVAKDVSTASGKTVVIPAGSVASLTIRAIEGAPERGEKGTLVMAATSIEIEGKSYPLEATAPDYQYDMKAHGIGASEIAKTGGGAAVGAVVGRVIGGDAGTVVGAVGGGVAGAAIAAKTADRDIVVARGNSVTLVLKEEFRRK